MLYTFIVCFQLKENLNNPTCNAASIFYIKRGITVVYFVCGKGPYILSLFEKSSLFFIIKQDITLLKKKTYQCCFTFDFNCDLNKIL